MVAMDAEAPAANRMMIHDGDCTVSKRFLAVSSIIPEA